MGVASQRELGFESGLLLGSIPRVFCEGECARVFLGVIFSVSVSKNRLPRVRFQGSFYGGPKAVGFGCDGAIAVPRVKSVEGVWS